MVGGRCTGARGGAGDNSPPDILVLVGRRLAGRGGPASLQSVDQGRWTGMAPPPPPPPPPGLSSHNTTISTIPGPASHPSQPCLDCVGAILLLLLVEDVGAECCERRDEAVAVWWMEKRRTEQCEHSVGELMPSRQQQQPPPALSLSLSLSASLGSKQIKLKIFQQKYFLKLLGLSRVCPDQQNVSWQTSGDKSCATVRGRKIKSFGRAELSRINLSCWLLLAWPDLAW